MNTKVSVHVVRSPLHPSLRGPTYRMIQEEPDPPLTHNIELYWSITGNLVTYWYNGYLAVENLPKNWIIV